MEATAETKSDYTIHNLLEAGLHFGHQTRRWNPKMKRYIFGKRRGVHVIDLTKTHQLLRKAAQFMFDTAAAGKSILFVGTKKQAQNVVKMAAESCGQYYVNVRWLGGTLTNNATIRSRIRRMRELEEMEKSGEFAARTKKEAARLRRELESLRRYLGGIANMNDLPGALFVADVNRDAIAVGEANKLGIPTVALVDTNCDPDPIDYVIPGNDDAIRSIKFVADVLTDAVRRGAAEYEKNAARIAREKEEEARKLAAVEAEASRLRPSVRPTEHAEAASEPSRGAAAAQARGGKLARQRRRPPTGRVADKRPRRSGP